MTDTQVADEKDLLASGEIPGLFDDSQVDEIISSLRNECKSRGIDDSLRENVWRYFIDKVRHIFFGKRIKMISRKWNTIFLRFSSKEYQLINQGGGDKSRGEHKEERL